MHRDELVEFEQLHNIRFSAEVAYSFQLNWVRRVALREVLGDLGVRLRSPRTASLQLAINGSFRLIKSVDALGQLRLRVYKTRGESEPAVSVVAAAPPPRQSDRDQLLKVVCGLASVRDAIYERAAECLETKYSSLIAGICDETAHSEPLLDASFPNTEAGLEAWLTCVSGDFTAAIQPHTGLETDRGRLSRDFSHSASIELFLPYLERKDWKSPGSALARARIHSNPSGQIFAGWAPQDLVENTIRLATFAAVDPTSSAFSFTVSHTEPPDESGIAITRQIPGNYVTTWFDAPGDRDSMYGVAYGQIAFAVQTLLRKELPRRWFSKPERYGRFAHSHAMLVYKCSRPFVGRTRTEFSYEFQYAASMRRFFRTAAQSLPAELERVQSIIAETSYAGNYQPNQSRDIIDLVQTRRQHLDRLMSAESTIIECFIEFGNRGNECRQYMAAHPEESAEQLATYAESFARVLNYRVRRIHPSLDCGDLALLLLMEASSALSGAIRGQSGMDSPRRQSPGRRLGSVR